MKTSFNSINNNVYVNNTDIISHCVTFINMVFGNATNLMIKFKKPLLSQANFSIGLEHIDGHVVGEFYVGGILFYLSYVPNDEHLHACNQDMYDIKDNLSTLAICYRMNNLSRAAVKSEFENIYGQMTDSDKVIAAKFVIDDTKYFTDVTYESISTMTADKPYHLGDRKFKIPIYVDDKLFCYRFSTVKEFNLG